MQGWIDNQRIARRNAYAIFISSGRVKPSSELDVFPLPYDDEINAGLNPEEITEFYNQYKHLL